MVFTYKGQRRVKLDIARVRSGEPERNQERNETLHCRFAAGGVASRKKGRNRFKTGKKRQRQRKVKI